MKNTSLTGTQKLLLAFFFFIVVVIGFMLKLPSAFRHVDKEMHAAFYFLAAAFLNLLFVGTKLFRHVLIFVVLYLFGAGIEAVQEYSNRFFRKRIHGRFDPEDLEWNLKGLVAFSILWLLYTGFVFLYKKSLDKTGAVESLPGKRDQ
ncbi:MAG: hypothetical protein EOO13_16475 [Chitinophagaceae bacterium]|nr:MAG: hypothetical protein EOO13_16475 [Chitinophagaceae bacterium]